MSPNLLNKLLNLKTKQPETIPDKTENATLSEEFERCVMCGAITNVPVSMPIDWRENYEFGFGQICAECAQKSQNEAE